MTGLTGGRARGSAKSFGDFRAWPRLSVGGGEGVRNWSAYWGSGRPGGVFTILTVALKSRGSRGTHTQARLWIGNGGYFLQTIEMNSGFSPPTRLLSGLLLGIAFFSSDSVQAVEPCGTLSCVEARSRIQRSMALDPLKRKVTAWTAQNFKLEAIADWSGRVEQIRISDPRTGALRFEERITDNSRVLIRYQPNGLPQTKEDYLFLDLRSPHSRHSNAGTHFQKTHYLDRTPIIVESRFIPTESSDISYWQCVSELRPLSFDPVALTDVFEQIEERGDTREGDIRVRLERCGGRAEQQTMARRYREALLEGLSCMMDPARAGGARSNEDAGRLMALLAGGSGNSFTIRCHAGESLGNRAGVGRYVGRASLCPSRATRPDLVRYPGLEVVTRGLSEEEYRSVLFHETLHNLGYTHGSVPDVTNVCANCCFPNGRTAQATALSCELCRMPQPVSARYYGLYAKLGAEADPYVFSTLSLQVYKGIFEAHDSRRPNLPVESAQAILEGCPERRFERCDERLKRSLSVLLNLQREMSQVSGSGYLPLSAQQNEILARAPDDLSVRLESAALRELLLDQGRTSWAQSGALVDRDFADDESTRGGEALDRAIRSSRVTEYCRGIVEGTYGRSSAESTLAGLNSGVTAGIGFRHVFGQEVNYLTVCGHVPGAASASDMSFSADEL